MTLSAIRVASGQGLRLAQLVGLGFVIRDQKAFGTHGGTSIAGMNIRDLNATLVNTISGAFLGTNQFTLPAGTYEIVAKAPSQESDKNRIYLYNVTDATEDIIGTSEYCNTNGWTFGSLAWLSGQFTIAAEKVFEIRHQIANATTTSGLGQANSLDVVEVYTHVSILEVS